MKPGGASWSLFHPIRTSLNASEISEPLSLPEPLAMRICALCAAIPGKCHHMSLRTSQRTRRIRNGSIVCTSRDEKRDSDSASWTARTGTAPSAVATYVRA